MGLSEIPREWGAVTFHSLYRMAGNHQLVFEREVREAGETLPLVPDKNTGGRLIKVTASEFRVSPCGPGSPVGCLRDEVWFNLDVRRTEPSALPLEKQNISVDGQVEDEKGVIYRYNQPKGISYGIMEVDIDEAPGEGFPLEERIFTFSIEKSVKTTGALKLRGQVWVDDRWPIPFEVALPPRPVPKPPQKK